MNMQTEDAGPNRPATIWRPLHAYLMAVVCLVIGVAIGYLVRGSEPPKNPATAVAMPATVHLLPTPAPNAEAAPANKPSLDDMKRIAEKQRNPC